MKLTDLNTGRDIGANCLLVDIGPYRLMIDAGLHPKKVGTAALPDFRKVDDFSVDFIILTHCHLDHVGALPIALRNQPQARVLTSQPSVTLAPRMLRNSCNVMLRQREELGLKEYPLFTFSEIDVVEDHLFPMAFDRPRVFSDKGEDIEITFHAAGHVAGAAGVSIVYKHRRIFFTGDVLFKNQYTLPGADFPSEEVDTLVMETTRGDTLRPTDYPREEEIERLIETIAHTLKAKGSVLIPVFAFGRMQEVMAILNDAMKKRRIPQVPVYGSGLGLDLVDYFDTISRKTGLLNFRRNIIQELGVKPLRAKLTPGQDVSERGIYVLSSGMLVENTPSYLVAASLVEHPHNAICYVGYCDPETPGGKMLACSHDDVFAFDSIDYVGRVRAQIERFDLSGHADRNELLDYARLVNPRAVVLTHGDPRARDWFIREFEEMADGPRVLDPEPGKTYSV